MQPLGQVGQTHHLGTETVGQQLTPIQAAIGNGHGFGLFGRKVGGHQFDHFSGPDKQDADVFEVFE